MDRRVFMKRSASGSAAFGVLAAHGAVGHSAQRQQRSALTANDVQSYVRSLGADWVDPSGTVDTFKAGDPGMEVKGIAVAWLSSSASLEKAVELGCNLFVTHEPTYYDHRDADQSVFAFEAARKKKAFIEKSRLAVIRCHDVWDRSEEIGMQRLAEHLAEKFPQVPVHHVPQKCMFKIVSAGAAQ